MQVFEDLLDEGINNENDDLNNEESDDLNNEESDLNLLPFLSSDFQATPIVSIKF